MATIVREKEAPMTKGLSGSEIHYLETWLGLTLNDPLIPDILSYSGFSALTASGIKAIPVVNRDEPGVPPSGQGKRSKTSSHKALRPSAFNAEALSYLSAEEEYFYRQAVDGEQHSSNNLQGPAGAFFAHRRGELLIAAMTIAHTIFGTQGREFLHWTRRYALIKYSGSPRRGRPIDQWLMNWEDPVQAPLRQRTSPDKIAKLQEQRQQIRLEFLIQWQALEKALGLDATKTLPELWSAKKRAFYEELWASNPTHAHWANASFFPNGFPAMTQETLIQLLHPRKDGRLDWDPCRYALTDPFDWLIALYSHQPIDDPQYQEMRQKQHQQLAASLPDPLVDQWMMAVARGEYNANDPNALTRFLKATGKPL